MKKQLIYSDCKDEDFDYTSAYYGEIIITDSLYIIPFIDIRVDKRIVGNKKDAFVDKEYFVFKNYNILRQEFYRYNGEKQITPFFIPQKNKIENAKEFMFGANSFSTKFINQTANPFDTGCEWEIECETFIFQLLETSKISDDLFGFTPFDTPNQTANIDFQEAINFMTNKYLPLNLKKLIESDTSTIRKVYQTDYQEPVLA